MKFKCVWFFFLPQIASQEKKAHDNWVSYLIEASCIFISVWRQGDTAQIDE